MVGQKSMCNLGQRGILMDVFILTTFDKVVIQLIKKLKKMILKIIKPC